MKNKKMILSMILAFILLITPVAQAKIVEDKSKFNEGLAIVVAHAGQELGPKTQAYIDKFKTDGVTPEDKILDIFRYMVNYDAHYKTKVELKDLDNKKGNCTTLTIFAAKLFEKAGLPYKIVVSFTYDKNGKGAPEHTFLVSVNNQGEPYVFESTSTVDLRDFQKKEEVYVAFRNRGANQEQIKKDFLYNYNTKKYSKVDMYITEWFNNDEVYDDFTKWERRFEKKELNLYDGSVEFFKPVDLKDIAVKKTEVNKVEQAPYIQLQSVLAIGSNIMKKSVDGVETIVRMDIAPFIKDGRTMLPIRFVAEALGFNVAWDNSTRTVNLSDKKHLIAIPVDTNEIIVNGVLHNSDVKPTIINGRTMLAIANVARALGLADGKDIIWDANSKAVIITINVEK